MEQRKMEKIGLFTLKAPNFLFCFQQKTYICTLKVE